MRGMITRQRCITLWVIGTHVSINAESIPVPLYLISGRLQGNEIAHFWPPNYYDISFKCILTNRQELVRQMEGC